MFIAFNSFQRAIGSKRAPPPPTTPSPVWVINGGANYSTNGTVWTVGQYTMFSFGTGVGASSGGEELAFDPSKNVWVSTGKGTYPIGYSSNGVNWTGIPGTEQVFVGDQNLKASAVDCNSALGIWIASGYGGGNALGNNVAYSSNGITWTGGGSGGWYIYWAAISKKTTGSWMGFCGGFGNYYTVNGAKWTSVSPPNNRPTHNPNNNMWVSLPASAVIYSSNGLTWTASPYPRALINGSNRITYNNNLWIAGATGGEANSIAYSTDGLSWTGLSNTPFAGNVNSIKYSSYYNMWIAGGSLYNGNNLAYSTNGVNWTGLGSAAGGVGINSLQISK